MSKKWISYHYLIQKIHLPIATETEIKQGPMKGQKSVSKNSIIKKVDGIVFPFNESHGKKMKIKR
jgi:hypothetical protein